jgi:PAS domain S-box-containing protein
LASFTAELASVFRAAIELAGLQLTVDCSPLPDRVYVDRDMWEKIVLNLLSNAFKFTLEGQIKVKLCADGQDVKLRVSDTGTGIPAAEMPHLFKRFHRVQNARGRTHEGSGIGLALVQELVRLHGVRITAESAIEKGTTFTIKIPQGTAHLPADQISSEGRLASATTGARPYVEEAMRWLPDKSANEDHGDEDVLNYCEALPTPAIGPVVGDGRPRVLVADDNADMRQYVARLLGERHEVKSVADGQTALLAAREWKPDLILADVMMPQLDGFGLLHQIRADSSLQETPVIMLSARAGEESRVEGMGAGADDYLVKPFSARELIARVEGHLKMARMRREAAERASYRTAQFEIVVDRSPVGIYLIDSDFRIRLVNPIACPVFGNIPDLIGRDFDQVIHMIWPQEYADELAQRFRHCLETGKSYECPERAEQRIDRNATECYQWRIDRTLLPDGQYGVVCYFRDISAEVRARQELEQSREALRRDASRKSEFLSTLAHELRNPLAPIVNSIELLKQPCDGDSRAAEARNVIQRQLAHMVRLVDDLLDISRITRDKLELRLERVALASVLDQSIEGCRPSFDQRGHRLEVSLPPEPVYLYADPVRLVQVFQNLLNNACRYTEPMGTVSVIVERKGDDAIVLVRDTGIGIPSDRLADVFEMFSQVHSEEILLQGGLGIGLALVKRLVEMHKGTVEARSQGLGKGAEFMVRLPALTEGGLAIEQPVAESATKERNVQSPPRRILVVDDNEDSAESLAQLLELNGHHVEKVHDGLAALEAVERLDPDVVLLDIGLPQMDGYEVCQAIRRNHSKHRPIVIALTGWGQDNDRSKSVEAGIDHHLVKPVAFDVLMQLLASLSADEKSTLLGSEVPAV